MNCGKTPFIGFLNTDSQKACLTNSIQIEHFCYLLSYIKYLYIIPLKYPLIKNSIKFSYIISWEKPDCSPGWNCSIFNTE